MTLQKTVRFSSREKHDEIIKFYIKFKFYERVLLIYFTLHTGFYVCLQTRIDAYSKNRVSSDHHDHNSTTICVQFYVSRNVSQSRNSKILIFDSLKSKTTLLF